MMIACSSKEEAREPNKTTNVVIAAFTTAYARMELYKYLEFLGPDRVYYFDTDSILFTERPGEKMPEKGDFLGQMTDELEGFGVGAYIIEFVSGGPKNYAIRICIPSNDKINPETVITVVKIKGITLNYKICDLINFDAMKRLVSGEQKPVEVWTNSIKRTNLADVYSTRAKKTYNFNYTKRQLTGDDYCTVPFGY